MIRTSTLLALGLSLTAAAAVAQPPASGPGGPGGPARPTGHPVEPRPDYVRTAAPADPVIQRMWAEGMERSQAATYAQRLLDSVGPRLTGSPGLKAGNDWLVATYRDLGITARNERWGTWNSWRRGIGHIDLVAPRVRSLEGMMLAWSPGTGGQPVEAEVVILPETETPEAFRARQGELAGKWVFIDPPRLSCRMQQQWAEYATPESRMNMDSAQRRITTAWNDRRIQAGNLQQTMKAAGAAGVIGSNWSQYPGIDKIFGTPNQQVPTFDVSCEDYGLLYRLAENGQKPRVRITAESEFLGEQPVFNTIAEIRGSEKPDEYVVLSAHFDSWDGASGATDNGTGTITMLEAMRILKATYPNPKRTIVVGHWGGEEQGLNGSRAFTEDHPEVVQKTHALFNQDNGTGRIVSMSPGGLVGAGPVLRRYLSELPSQITQYISYSEPGFPAGGGSDNASWACSGAPAFGLNALSWDYGNTTWHTNRDTYDKIVLDDLKSNATLVAMLAYQASEDPTFMPRERLTEMPVNPRTGQAQTWPECQKAIRTSAGYRR
jgi:hypothetical protein